MGQTSNKFALWISIGRVMAMLVVFIMPLILTRFLSKEDYGVFSQFFTLYSALYIIFGFGLSSNLFYFYPTANDENQKKYVANTFLSMVCMSIFSVIILSLPFVQNSLFSDGRLNEFKWLVMACVALAVPMNIIAPIYTVRKDKIGALVLPAGVAILRVGIIVLCAVLFSSLLYIFIGLLLYQLLIFLISYFYSLKFKFVGLDKGLLKKQLNYSIPVGITVVLLQLSNYLDKIICISNIKPDEYAVYSVAFLSIPFINQIYDALCQVNVMNMTTSYQENNLVKVVSLYRDFVTKTLSFSTPIILAVALFSEEIIGLLYPATYSSAAPYFRIYTLTFLFAMFGAGTVLRATDKTRYSTASFVMAFMISFPTTYFLIKSYEVNGAIIGAVINLILPRFIQMMFEVRATNSNIMQFLPWKNLLIIFSISVGLLVPIVLLKSTLCIPFWGVVVLSTGYIFISYYLMINLNIFITNKDTIFKMINKLKK